MTEKPDPNGADHEDGDKIRPPMPDDGNDYEWDVDFGWIEAMPNERP